MTKNESTLNDVLAAVNTGFADVDKKLTQVERKVDTLTTSFDGLAHKVNSYLTQEWNVHLHNDHPSLEQRLTAIERKLGIKAA